MSSQPVSEPVSPGRMVATAALHAVFLTAFVVFMVRMIPEFAVQAGHTGRTLPPLVQGMIRWSSLIVRYWYLVVPLLALADTVGLFTSARVFGKRGLIVWSVLVSGALAAEPEQEESACQRSIRTSSCSPSTASAATT